MQDDKANTATNRVSYSDDIFATRKLKQTAGEQIQLINCLSTVTVVKNHETVNRVETLKIMHYPFRLQGGHEQSPNASKTKWKNEAQKETEISKAQHSRCV